MVLRAIDMNPSKFTDTLLQGPYNRSSNLTLFSGLDVIFLGLEKGRAHGPHMSLGVFVEGVGECGHRDTQTLTTTRTDPGNPCPPIHPSHHGVVVPRSHAGVPVVCDAVMDLLGGAADWFCRISPEERCRGDGID